MRRKIRDGIAGFSVAITFLWGASSEAQDLRASLGLSVTAGLDDRTYDLLKNYPSDLREQMFQLLKQSLPLVDKSVSLYLEKVNEILDVQINHLQCSVTGAEKQLED